MTTQSVKIKYSLEYMENELADIKNKLDETMNRQEFELLKERVARLEKLLQSKRVKSV